MDPIEARLKCDECGEVTLVRVWVFDEAEMKQTEQPMTDKEMISRYDIHIYCMNCKLGYSWDRRERKFVNVGREH